MQEKLPNSKKCISLPAYNPNIIRSLLSMELVEKPLKVLEANQVLIRVKAASCNPSDIAFLQGGYNIVKTLPAVPGFEGTGKVVACGPGADDLLDENVSFFTQADEDGSWSDYLITNAGNCNIISENLPLEQAAAFSINPFTAYGLIERARINKSTAVIVNAAGGQLAGLIRSIAAENSTQIINIVRKQQHIEKLNNAGAKYVLCSSDDDFEKQLIEIAHLLKATTAFDAVAGDQSGILLACMPGGSELIVYGGLSGKPVSGIEVLDIIFHKKIVSGFDLNRFYSTKNRKELMEISGELENMFLKGKLINKVQLKTKLSDFRKGIRQYLGDMSAGKVLLIP